MSEDTPSRTVTSAAQSLFEGFLPEDPFSDDQEPKADGGAEEGIQEPEPTAAEPDDFDESAAEAFEPEAAEEPEEEGEEPEDDEPEEVEEPARPEPEDYTVKVDGEEVSVSLDELRAGYSRTASWTRKSQHLAQERKAFEQEQQAVRAEREKYGEMLGTLEQQLQAKLPQEPRTDDPREWVTYQRQMGEMARVREEQAKLQASMRADWEAERSRVTNAENEKLQTHFPDWKDESVALEAKQGLVSYATGLGFDPDELSNVYDHRVVILLAKAKAYDELDAQKKVVRSKTKKAPVLKPGQPKGRARGAKTRRKSRSQRDQLRESGHVDDAAAIVFSGLDDD